MSLYRAAWLLPISQPPIRDGWIRTDAGRIVALGAHTRGNRGPADEIDLGQVAVLPGLVNAHAHLELSWLRGRVQQADNFLDWIRCVVGHIARTDKRTDAPRAAIHDAIVEARDCGTVLIGDISNDLVTSQPLADQRMAALVFHELIAFNAANAQRTVSAALERLSTLPPTPGVRHTLAPHAPYSVSPALFESIRTALRSNPVGVTSVHLGESTAELQFLRDGSGPWREFLDDVKAWDPAWTPPRCGPVEYLDRLAFLDRQTLAVHGVHLRRDELQTLADRKSTLVTCPRGNRLTGAGSPPVSAFYASGVRVAIGTDSLASVPDLNLFSELSELRRIACDVPAGALLESATLSGARALGFDAEFGSLEAGKRASLIAVALPAGVQDDVEEYLVSGITRTDISIIDGSQTQ